MATDWRSKLGFSARLAAVTKMQVPQTLAQSHWAAMSAGEHHR
jgi:hypothetical protein